MSNKFLMIIFMSIRYKIQSKCWNITSINF